MAEEIGNFDDALTPIPNADTAPMTMDFPDAMKKILDGRKIRRESWSGDDYCVLDGEWLSIYTNGAMHVWKINDGDMQGQDWVIVQEDKN